jgi:hypothetical protein
MKETTRLIYQLLEDTGPEAQPQQDEQVTTEDDIAVAAAMDDSVIKGEEDPIKGFIDKLINTKNLVLKQSANNEITKAIQ